MATAKDWKTLRVTSASIGTVPTCAAFMVKHNPVASGSTTGTVTVKNPYNGDEFTVAEGQIISINPQFETRGAVITVTGDSVAEVVYWL